MAGEFLIGLYIGKQGLESTYGAAASIVVVLIWVREGVAGDLR
jgi:membrane protein